MSATCSSDGYVPPYGACARVCAHVHVSPVRLTLLPCSRTRFTAAAIRVAGTQLNRHYAPTIRFALDESDRYERELDVLFERCRAASTPSNGGAALAAAHGERAPVPAERP